MQSCNSDLVITPADDVLEYYDILLEACHERYLQMPYREQSQPGLQFKKNYVYLLQTEWNNLRGNDWPGTAPTTKEDIDNLPDWIKVELVNVHQITDLYTQIVISDHTMDQKFKRNSYDNS
jgi:hypothetical protein